MSTIVTSNISDGTDTVGTEYVVNGSAKSWCRINQTGTQSIQDSLNTSSITDEGVGYTAVTLNNAMANTDWSVQLTGTGSQTNGGTAVLDSSGFFGSGTSPYRTTTQFNLRGVRGDGTDVDNADVNSAAFGDFA